MHRDSGEDSFHNAVTVALMGLPAARPMPSSTWSRWRGAGWRRHSTMRRFRPGIARAGTGDSQSCKPLGRDLLDGRLSTTRAAYAGVLNRHCATFLTARHARTVVGQVARRNDRQVPKVHNDRCDPLASTDPSLQRRLDSRSCSVASRPKGASSRHPPRCAQRLMRQHEGPALVFENYEELKNNGRSRPI